jgi:hypothetical protein
MTAPEEPDRTVVVAQDADTLPPVGTVGEIVGASGVRGSEAYCLRFPAFPEVWMHLPSPMISLRDGDRALKPPLYRYAFYDSRWWARILVRLGIYRFIVHRGTADQRLLGAEVRITGGGYSVPVGTVGKVAGHDGPLYTLTFRPYFARIVTRLPAKGIEVTLDS